MIAASIWHSSVWLQGIPGALVSLIAAIASFHYYWKNRKLSREIADRTVTFDAQKLLLEINKQFVDRPELLAIYDDDAKNWEALETNKELKERVRALGYLTLNVFEIVFSQLPSEPRDAAWKAYLLDSLDRCSVLRDELKTSKGIYHPRLIEEYEKWDRDEKGKAARAAARNALKAQSGSKTATPISPFRDYRGETFKGI